VAKARGIIVDATIISASSSTKNAEKMRDSDMHQTKKANQWYFGMKANIGIDKTKLIHAVVAPPPMSPTAVPADPLASCSGPLVVKESVRIHARSHAVAVRTERIGKALPYGLGHTPWVTLRPRRVAITPCEHLRC
jgi:Transposase DDE domain